MADQVDFIGNHPEDTAAMLERLATDLRKLGGGYFPSALTLNETPLLSLWAVSHRPRPCLIGSMCGHPLIEQGRVGVTSEIYAIDRNRRWARTLSRFYKLGPAALTGQLD